MRFECESGDKSPHSITAASDTVIYSVGTDGSLSVSRMKFQGMSQAVVSE